MQSILGKHFTFMDYTSHCNCRVTIFDFSLMNRYKFHRFAFDFSLPLFLSISIFFTPFPYHLSMHSTHHVWHLLRNSFHFRAVQNIFRTFHELKNRTTNFIKCILKCRLYSFSSCVLYSYIYVCVCVDCIKLSTIYTEHT